MVGFPAARLTDLHICPMFTVLVPHVGGPIAGPGAPTVLIGKLPAARVTDMCVCVGPPDMIAKGSATVLTMKLPQARVLDNCVHGGMIVLGCFTVLVGDGAGGGGGGGGAGAALLAKILSGKSNIKIEGTPEFQLKTMMALAKLAATPSGLALLQSLEASGQTVTIKQTTDANGYCSATNWPQNGNLGKPGTGSGSTVEWNPEFNDLGQGQPWSKTDPAIILGHELVHANHNAYGQSQIDPEPDPGNPGQSRDKPQPYTGLDGNTHNAPVEEQNTAGVGTNSGFGPSENDLRREMDERGLSDPKAGQRQWY